jgi:type IX secretion system PorP/SprF family membrane protein
MPKYILFLGLITLNLLIFPVGKLQAQDPQFSQFYAVPLYMNPAFAGSSQLTRFGAIYRNQWYRLPETHSGFVTMAAYGDHYADDINSGFGLLVMQDRAGLAPLVTSSAHFQYAYQLRMTKELTFRPGIEFAYQRRRIDYGNFVFGNQFDGFDNFNSGIPHGEDLPEGGEGFGIFDMGLGGLLYSKNLWVGWGTHHILRPDISFGTEEFRLQMRHSFHAGYRILLDVGTFEKGYTNDRRERSITPAMQYKRQGPFAQLDLGAYLTFEPIVFGLWYRGLPVRPNDGGIMNNESLILLVGYSLDNLRIGYSFDFTVSRLGIGTGGAHEVSVTYVVDLRDPKRPPKSVRRIPCPNF